MKMYETERKIWQLQREKKMIHCVSEDGEIVPTSPCGTCIKDEKSPDDTECIENEKKIWKLSSYIKVIRKYAKKYKHQF